MPKRRPTFYPLIPVDLTQVTTSDGVTLAGVVVEPKGRKKAALIWLHGLTSSFDGGQELMRQLSAACVQRGIGYFKFNTRGHDIAAHGPKRMIGSAFEKFADSRKDIDAMIALVRRRGYNNIILAGHSTGANKIVYYLYRRQPRNVRGLILVGPVSDIVGQIKLIGRRRLATFVRKSTRVSQRQPMSLVNAHGQLISAQRAKSLFTPGVPEDTFPWYNPKARWAAMSSIRKPLLVVFGGKDNYLDRPAKDVVNLFKAKAASTKHFTGRAVPGASHGFHRHQRQLVQIIGQWLDKTV